MLPTISSPRKRSDEASILSAPLAAARTFYARASASRSFKLPRRIDLDDPKGSARLSIPSRSTLLFVGGCLLWYLSSALASNTSKALMSSPKKSHDVPPIFPYPVTLTLVQFVFVHFFSQACASKKLLGQHRLATIVKPSWDRIREVGLVSIFNVIGHALSALAISRVPVSSVHTIKALAPLFTVASYKLMFNVSYSVRTYFSLLPLTLGVMMACTGLSLSLDDIVGILAALSSTIVFVAQNITSKKLISGTVTSTAGPKGGRPKSAGASLDKLNVLYYSSGVSILLTIPLFLFMDFGRLLFSDRQTSSISNPAQIDVGSQSIFGPGILVWSLLLANGIVHFAQNLLAFNVLGLVSPVTYSIASLLKRVFVICFAIVWFQQKVSLLQWCGIILTFIGLYLYNSTKTKADVAKNEASVRRQERRASLALPTTQSEALVDLDLNDSYSPSHPRSARILSPTSNVTTHSGFVAHPSADHQQQLLYHAHASAYPYTAPPRSGSKGFQDVSGAGAGHSGDPPASPYVQDPRRSLPSPPPSGRTSADAP